MRVRRGIPVFRLAAGLLLAAGLGCVTGPAPAATMIVNPGPDALAAAVAAAAPGDVLRLAPGGYDGGLTIGKALTLEGIDDVVIDGHGSGSVIRVSAPDVVLRGLTIRGSGARLEIEDSGVFVTETGDRVRIENNRFEGNLIGIFLKGPRDALVRGNTIVGRADLRMNERGNGVQLWKTPGSIVENNNIRYGRDGIFVTTSRNNIFRNNRFDTLRFAIHYMYTNDSEISGNISRGNHVGYALMFSSRLKVIGNLSESDRDHGILLNYGNESQIEGNIVRAGGGKCVFIYNTNKNRFRDNWFEGCLIGVHFTAGSERNSFSGNAFVANRTQVKYVGSRDLDWASAGRGNYWSDNPAFDLNGDGIADAPYQPNDLVDRVMWSYPAAKLLLSSPAVQLLRWAQSEFPALHPGGVVDSAPLMRPPKHLRLVAARETAG